MKDLDPTGKHKIGSSKVDFLEPRLRENLHRFYKGMGDHVEKMKEEKGWVEVYVTGETELAKAFSESMHEKPKSTIHKNLNNSKPHEIISQILEK